MATYSIKADQIVDVIPVFATARRVPLFVGPPGCAKTAMVREAARLHGDAIGQHVEVRELHLASMSEVDVRGYLIPDGDQAKFTKPEFWAAVEAHPHGVLFLDEFPQAPHEVQKAVAPLVLEGRIGEYTLPAGWSVVLDGNRSEDNAGANTLLSHIVNRVVIVNVTPPDATTGASWAVSAGVAPEICAFAQLRPDVVFGGELPADPDTPYATPRSLHALSDVANAFPGGLHGLVHNRVGMALLSGAIGVGAATELAALVRTSLTLPAFSEVVADPAGTPVPVEPDMAYAMVMLCATRATAVNVDAVVQYLTRFSANYTLAGVVSMARRDRSLLSASAALGKWVVDNKATLAKFSHYITGNV